ncbi:uncharacterized protein LOC135132538 isoform X3 [Zophobas morio]|uniref:uncharacterized protein LOC135132538 isoform X3 n=1 Tax=Zophobas morio TaxID=2755281 RepID=UPI003082816F
MYECYHRQKFWKRSSRKITSTANIKRPMKPDLVYYEISYSCILGGENFKSRSKGLRKSITFRLGSPCAAYIRLCVSPDGQTLDVKSFNDHHNHICVQNRWTVSQVETLIDQYKKYPVLYDPSHEDYSNTAVKNACLVNIVEALQTVRSGVTEADVTSQWNNLMVKYSQATQSQEPQFWYLHKLEFLQDHVGTTDVKLEDCDNEECDETNLFEPEIATKAHEWRDGTDPLESCVEVKEEIEDAPLAKKQKNEDEPVESGGLSEDESDVFGKFVASQLRKIVNEEVKQDTIFEIHKLLYKALKK